ncbi:hypothetical protein EMCRGX_G020793 [Ephydatia muelleri]
MELSSVALAVLTFFIRVSNGSASSQLAQMWIRWCAGCESQRNCTCGSQDCCVCTCDCLEYATGVIIGLVGLQLVTLIIVCVETCYICGKKRNKMDKRGFTPLAPAIFNRNEDTAITSLQASPNPAYSLLPHDPTQTELAPRTIQSARGNAHTDDASYVNMSSTTASSRNQIGVSECPVPLPGNYAKVTPRPQREVTGARVTNVISPELRASSTTNSKELTPENGREGAACDKENERMVHKNEALYTNLIGVETNNAFPHSLALHDTKEGRHLTASEVNTHRPSSLPAATYTCNLSPEVVIESILSVPPLLPIKEISTNTSITSNPVVPAVLDANSSLEQNNSLELKTRISCEDNRVSVSISTLPNSRLPLGAAARITEQRKHCSNDAKCDELAWVCVPLVVESYGAWEKKDLESISQLASCLATCSSKAKSVVLTELYGPDVQLVIPVKVEAAVAESLPVEVILGTDASSTTELLGRQAGSLVQEDAMVVTTRAKRRQELLEEIVRKEKERRQMRRELGSKEDSPDGCSSYINITAEKLKDLQEQDETLAVVRALAQKAGGSRGEFFKRNKLLYRRWIPKGRGEEMEVEQLVLPKECQQVALEMSHDIPIAGHQGRDRTRQ